MFKAHSMEESFLAAYTPTHVANTTVESHKTAANLVHFVFMFMILEIKIFSLRMFPHGNDGIIIFNLKLILKRIIYFIDYSMA
ncbi:hypothetical protein IKI14_07245 [bacterium]|nr:hypothetical protein [bacterium]